MSPSHVPEVVDRASKHLQDRANPLQDLAGSSHQNREAAAAGAFRTAGDGGIQVVDVLAGKAFRTALSRGRGNGGAIQHHTAGTKL